MIKSRDVNKDLAEIEERVKTNSVTDSDIVKVLSLLTKVVRDIRANQVTLMKANGVKLIEPRTDDKPKEEPK